MKSFVAKNRESRQPAPVERWSRRERWSFDVDGAMKGRKDALDGLHDSGCVVGGEYHRQHQQRFASLFVDSCGNSLGV